MDHEDKNIEYKRWLTNKVKREIVSFLNTDGETVFLGVDDQSRKPLAVSNKDRHDWEEIINHWYTNAFYPTPFGLLDIRPNDKVFTVKVKPGRHKPYALASEGFTPRGVYVRYGSSAVKATNEQIKRMLQQNARNDEFDSEKSANQCLTFNELKKRSDAKNIQFNVKALHMIKHDDIYNNAAFLASDQNSTIAKVAIYQGTDVMEFKDKREIAGALTSQIDELLYFINLNNHTRVKINGNPQRYEVKDYPEAAIREAVVNAFAHRDYLLHSTIKVEIFDNRMDIMSPGGIPDGLTLEEVKDGMTAVRNPQLVHILDKLGYIENYGTGIRRMYEAYQYFRQTPQFEVRANSFKVTLPNINWQVQTRDVDTQKSRIKQSEIDPLTVNEETILSLLKQNGRRSRKEVQELLGITSYSAIKLLNNLIRQGKVRKVGKSINTHYEIKL